MQWHCNFLIQSFPSWSECKNICRLELVIWKIHLCSCKSFAKIVPIPKNYNVIGFKSCIQIFTVYLTTFDFLWFSYILTWIIWYVRFRDLEIFCFVFFQWKLAWLSYIRGIIFFCTTNGFFIILEKTSSELICRCMYIGRYARTYLQPHYRPFGKKLFLHTSWDSWWMEGTPIMFCIGSLDYKITIYQVTAPTSKTMQPASNICTKYSTLKKLSDFSNVPAD